MNPRLAACMAGATVSLLAGCGAGGGGTATLWITRDEGRTVLLTTTVPAGRTAMQALDGVADVETRYGGRFVQAIDGVEGSLAAGRDWFYFVNGYEADRSAAEYRLHAGDVEWWDFRAWRGRREATVVVGAFPEPFLHGFGGRRRPVAVLYERGRDAAVARKLGRVVHAELVGPASAVPPKGSNTLLVLGRRSASFYPEPQAPVNGPGDEVLLVASPDVARRLAANPAAYRFRYVVRP